MSETMDYRIGRLDLIVWTKEEDGNIQIGKVDKVSADDFKLRIGDGRERDLCGDPIYKWVYPKLYPIELLMQVKPVDVKLSNRHLRVGVVVKRGPQIGFVQEIFHQVSIKFLNYNLYLEDVEAHHLLDPWQSAVLPRRPIFYKGWIGRVGSAVKRHVYLKWEDSIGYMEWNELSMLFLNEHLVTTSETCFEINGFCFYPGRKFCVSEKCIHEKTSEGKLKWAGSQPVLKPSKDSITLQICQTELQPFKCRWLHNATPGLLEVPPERLTVDDLPQLSWIRPFNYFHLGDLRMFEVKPDDYPKLFNYIHWNAYLKQKYSSITPKQRELIATSLPSVVYPNEEDKPAVPIPVEIIAITSEAEVEWMDGTTGRYDSRDVVRIRNTRYAIGAFVQEKNSEEGFRNKYGTIQRVHLKGCHADTAIIKWIIRPTIRDQFSGLTMIKIEEMELQDIEPHTYYNFTSTTNQNVIVVTNYSARHLFTVGCVINTYPDGKVRVRDISGMLFSVWPDEINRITPTV